MIKSIVAVIMAMSFALSGTPVELKPEREVPWNEISIRVAGYKSFNDDRDDYAFSEGAEKFTGDYGTEVSFMVGGGDGMGEDLIAALVAGDVWEIQYVHGMSVFPVALAEELYIPVTDYIDFESNKMIDKISMAGTAWKGEYYGISNLPMQDFHYLAYNETWMKELSVKTPHEYLSEGKWTMDAYKELNAAAAALNAPSRSAYTRPHVATMFMCDWNDKTGEVAINYDSPENKTWLSHWRSLLAEPGYNIKSKGGLSDRGCIMYDDMTYMLIKEGEKVTGKDVIRYIHYPNFDGGYGMSVSDSHFLFPIGITKEKIECAVMLASYMADAQGRKKSADYSKNMKAEDYALFGENMKNVYYLPRVFSAEAYKTGEYFRKDMESGKSVETHIAEQLPSLRAEAEWFNRKYAD